MDNQLKKRHTYTRDELIEMRKRGRQKPPEVTWAEWQEPFKINDKHEVLAHMAAGGISNKKIAEEIGLNYVTVTKLVKSERISFRIKELQYQLFGKNQQRRFESLSTKAIDTLSDILEDKAEKGATRLSAAREVLDRAMGKPRQTIEHQDSKLASIYDKLDNIIGQQEGSRKSKEVIEEVEYKELEAEEDKKPKKEEEKEIAEEEEVDKFFEDFYGEE